MKTLFSHTLKLLMIYISLSFYTSSLCADVLRHQSEEERLFKAALIYNFAKFTTWPENTPDQFGPIKLCTLGKNQLIDDLKKLDGKAVKGRQVSIIPVKRNEPLEKCHILYIADTEKKHYKKTLNTLNGKPVLTVSSLKDFAKQKGIIQFYRENRRTRLIINLSSAHHAGLEISSRLLILAKIIETQATP